MEKKPQDSESRSADKFIVRLPDGMRSRLKEAAKENGRSMNAEIIGRIEASFNPAPSADADERLIYVIGGVSIVRALLINALVRLRGSSLSPSAIETVQQAENALSLIINAEPTPENKTKNSEVLAAIQDHINSLAGR